MEVSDIISLIALLFSIIIGYFTVKQYKEQSKINQQIHQLNTYLLLNEKSSSQENLQAKLHATKISIGKLKKLRISNIGKHDAHNLQIHIEENDLEFFDLNTMNSQFPLSLKPHAKTDILMSDETFSFTHNPRIKITLTWNDGFQQNRSEVFDIT